MIYEIASILIWYPKLLQKKIQSMDVVLIIAVLLWSDYESFCSFFAEK